MARPGSTASRGTGRASWAPSAAATARRPGPTSWGVARAAAGGGGVPEPPPEVELAERLPRRLPDLPEQPDHRVRGGLEAGGVEDLRADVAVQPGELERRLPDDPHGGGQRVTGGQREAELLVLVRGRDGLVRVRLDADGG